MAAILDPAPSSEKWVQPPPNFWPTSIVASALKRLVGRQKGHLACKKCGGMVEVGTGLSGWSGAQPDGRCVCLC